ncbi:MAG: TVP38/TMEM64 family protein [Deltaproteobacteria bacterium]|nr:MAG: TVP38/TMEM64 family protein [Deltaproteobacteria bacterium]
MESEKKGNEKGKNRWKVLLLLALIVALIVVGRAFNLGEKLAALKDWIGGLGPLGPIVYVLLYVAAVVLAIPGSAITIAGGALFGAVTGTILVSVGSTIGAGLAFLIARYLARDAVSSWLEKNEKFQKLDRLTEEKGAVIVAITRLVPLFPFNLLNYGFGLTRVRFGTYLFWSWLCMLPGTVFYVAGADAVAKTLSSGKVPWKLLGAVIAAGVILFFLVKRARKKLEEKPSEKSLDGGGK